MRDYVFNSITYNIVITITIPVPEARFQVGTWNGKKPGLIKTNLGWVKETRHSAFLP